MLIINKVLIMTGVVKYACVKSVYTLRSSHRGCDSVYCKIYLIFFDRCEKDVLLVLLVTLYWQYLNDLLLCISTINKKNYQLRMIWLRKHLKSQLKYHHVEIYTNKYLKYSISFFGVKKVMDIYQTLMPFVKCLNFQTFEPSRFLFFY